MQLKYALLLFMCLAAVLPPTLSFANCAIPVVSPLSYERPNWKELEMLSVSKGLNSNIEFVQELGKRGHGKLNIDFYGVTVLANGQSAEELFVFVRENLNDLIFSGTSYALNSYDDDNDVIWKKDDPTGALMSFTLAGIDGIMPLERGSVVVSCFSTTSFVFSTVHTDKDGLHPVAGNRAFGVHDHGDGTFTIYVKAADRIVNEGIFGLMPEVGRELIFQQGHAVWQRMLKTISERFEDRSPVAFEFSERVDY